MKTSDAPLKMTASKPYLLRAIYEWIMDNHMTPYIMADTRSKSVKVPLQYVRENKIILNISMSATGHLQMKNDYITFSARFSGKSMQIIIPSHAVLAIYAKETGNGMTFEPESESESESESEQAFDFPAEFKQTQATKTNLSHSEFVRPHLKLVKSHTADSDFEDNNKLS